MKLLHLLLSGSLALGAVGCSSSSSSPGGPGSDGGRDSASGGESDSGSGGDSGGDGGCVKDSGAPNYGDAATDGGCSGLATTDCITCCQASYPKGAAAYANDYGTCACSLCGSVCPVTCGCGTVEDDTCTNCINGDRSNDAGCFSTLDSMCKSDTACNAYLACANGLCQAGL